MSTTPAAPPRRTPLYEAHRASGASLVDFHGWEMPIRYGQIPAEHQKCRLSAGLFDLCHMGRLEVTGPEALAWVQSIITNDLEAMEVGDARYSLIVNEEGGILDDVIVYRLESSVLVVVNASNREKIIAWMEAHRPPGGAAALTDRTFEWAMVSVQGPQAVRILTPLVKLTDVATWDLFDYYHICWGETLGKRVLIARTGYTGEDGFEVYYPAECAVDFWSAVLEAGGARISPIGLGARDTLRLEAGMPLYGNELSEDVNPFEARLDFAVKLKKTTPFQGQAALQKLKEQGVAKRLVGFRVDSKKVARQGMAILRAGPDADGRNGAPPGAAPAESPSPEKPAAERSPAVKGAERVGTITSGVPSPTLGFPIALGYLDSKVVEPDGLLVDIRGACPRLIPEPLPFFSRTRRRSDRAL